MATPEEFSRCYWNYLDSSNVADPEAELAHRFRAAIKAELEWCAELCEIYDPESVTCSLCGAEKGYCCRGTQDEYEGYTFHGVRWADAIRARAALHQTKENDDDKKEKD